MEPPLALQCEAFNLVRTTVDIGRGHDGAGHLSDPQRGKRRGGAGGVKRRESLPEGLRPVSKMSAGGLCHRPGEKCLSFDVGELLPLLR